MSNPAPDLLLRAILAKLPPAGAQWSLAEQVLFLQLLAGAFNMVFKNRRTIRVTTDPEKGE